MGKTSKFSGKWAIVTGAAGGIGLEFSKCLVAQGANVVVLDKDSGRLRDAVDTLEHLAGDGVKCLGMEADLTSAGIIDELEDFCRRNAIEPEILINNAGVFAFKPMIESDPRKTGLFIDLHVRALTDLSVWFCARRKEREGWLLNMSSMSCWMPMPGLAMYASTKAYIRVFTRALHYEMRDSGMKVMVACPGGIATDLFGLPRKWQKFAVGIGVLATPAGFVKKALKRLAKGKKQYINGWLNRFSIFFVGVTPTPVRMMVKHKLLDKGIQR